MNKKIFLVISNLTGGGSQRVVSVLSKALSSHYHPFIVLHDGKKIDYLYSGELIDLNTPVDKQAAGKVIAFFKRISKLKKLKGRLKPAAVISFLESSNFINLLSGRNGKTIISVRNFKSKQGRSRLGRLFHFLIRYLYNRSDLIVVPSAGIKADLTGHFNISEEKIKVIYNPYDLQYIDQQAAKELSGQEKQFFDNPVIITAGSLSKQKGHSHLIRSFKLVKERAPQARLYILGEGSLRPYLEEIIVAYGLTDAVSMPGFKDNPFQYIRRARLYILPSLFEGLPNALVEAMACGVPVVAADCPSGPREILAPGSGYEPLAKNMEMAEYGMLLPACSGEQVGAKEPLSSEEEIMAEAMVKLLTDQSLCEAYSQKSRNRVEDFTVSRIVRQWVELIEA